MNKEEVLQYLRKQLDKALEEDMRRELNRLGYMDTFHIRSDVKDFEEVMKYISDNLK